jgi:organic hydroperoxide reductase OsmC/OhrA
MTPPPAAHEFESILTWPTDESQARPPQPAFSRNNDLVAAGKPPIPGSAPTVFGGDASRYNPEELLLMALSQCHMLTFLAIAAKKKLAILRYADRATGTLAIGEHGTTGKMSMQEVVLRPVVTLGAGVPVDEAVAIHDKAHANCFIANSVNFPVRIEAAFQVTAT